MLDTKQILQKNLKALLATRPETSRLNLSREMKVADGTLGSIQYGKGNPTLEVIETIAKFFGLETWQLFCPNLGKPPTTGVTGGPREHFRCWPFSGINLAEFTELPKEDRDEIEHQIAYKVKRLKQNNHRKRSAPGTR
jgi:transcriptional regulator with XRE-family HTH domain